MKVCLPTRFEIRVGDAWCHVDEEVESDKVCGIGVNMKHRCGHCHHGDEAQIPEPEFMQRSAAF